LRSHRWLGVEDLRAFGHRSRMARMGFMPEDYAGKPVIDILNTWSDLSPCHAHFRARAEEAKRGVWHGEPTPEPEIH
jgi:dihydroxyacid dehydratase/phosphogluconate dehydratase